MSIPIIILRNRRNYFVMLGDWNSIDEVNEWLDSGSTEVAIALKKYRDERKDCNEGNFEILRAMALSAGDMYSFGRELQELLNFVFDLGMKIERSRHKRKRPGRKR